MYHETESYGSKSANGSWSGMIALVKNREADVGIGDFITTSERSNVVDFIDTVEFSRSGTAISFPFPVLLLTVGVLRTSLFLNVPVILLSFPSY